MTIEAVQLLEQRRDGVRPVRKVIKKGKRRRISARCPPARPIAPPALQELFVTCRGVFNGPGTVPLPEGVQNLSRILDNMKLEDFWLSSDLPFFHPGGTTGIPRVTTATIYSCENFSMSLFILPPASVIPLHNHPGMTVFSKLLLGTVHIKAYDWADSGGAPSPHSKLAKLVADKEFTAACNTRVLYPTAGGNIHAFAAVTPCIIIDVLGPPYSKNQDRDCTFYDDAPCVRLSCSSGEGELGYAWLEEIEAPANSGMDAVEYLGPPIVDFDP